MIFSFGATSKKQGGNIHDFAVSKLVMLTIQKAGRMVISLDESLHNMWIDCETVYWST